MCEGNFGVNQLLESSISWRVQTWSFSLFTHALVPMPPSTENSWHKLTTAYTFASRLLLNDFRTQSATEVRRRAGFPSAEDRWYRLTFKFLYQCCFAERRYGRWLREDAAEDALRRRSERNVKNPHALKKSAYSYINMDGFKRGGLYLALQA